MDKLFSNEQMIRDFMEGPVWKDMTLAIERSLDGAKMDLEVAAKMTEVTELQGVIKAHRYMLSIPQVLLEALEDAREKGETEDGRYSEGD